MIRTATVIWNAQLERRAIRCLAAPAADRELTGELGTPQRNSPGKPGVDQARDTSGCYSGYSEDSAIDNVSSPEPGTRRDYSEDTQMRA
jgi:hypothetical protein